MVLAQSFGDAWEQYGTQIVRDPRGGAVMVVQFVGTGAVASAQMPATAPIGVIVLAVDDDGRTRWTQVFGPVRSERIAVSKEGEVAFCGFSIRGEGALATDDVALTKIRADGEIAWTHTFSGPGRRTSSACAIDPSDGSIALVGYTTGATDFGGGALVGEGAQAYVARFDAKGKHLWSKRFGGSSSDFGAVAIDHHGAIVLGGSLGTMQIGSLALKAKAGGDALVLKLARNGETVFAHRFGEGTDTKTVDSDDFVTDVVVDDADDIYVTGAFGTRIDFGTTSLDSAGQRDGFLAKFDDRGNVRWARRFGSKLDETGQWIALDESKRVVITMRADHAVDFGSGLVGVPSTLFLTRYERDGKLVASYAIDRPFGDATVGHGSELLAIGTFEGFFSYGQKRLASGGGHDVVFARFAHD